MIHKNYSFNKLYLNVPEQGVSDKGVLPLGEVSGIFLSTSIMISSTTK
jgi:hypothetical protein